VFDSIYLSEQSIWLAVALFYILDNVKQIPGNTMVFRETWRFSWVAELPSNAFVFNNRQFVLLHPFLPYTITLAVQWLTPEPTQPARILRADRILRVARRRVFPFRIISVLCFFAFFIAGPVLTWWYGLTFATLNVLPFYVASLLMLLMVLISNRHFWHLTAWQITAAAIEAAICPAYLINFARRITWKLLVIGADGAAYGLLRSEEADKSRFRVALAFTLEELEREVTSDAKQRVRMIDGRVVPGHNSGSDTVVLAVVQSHSSCSSSSSMSDTTPDATCCGRCAILTTLS
jgi:hypothetical protein